MIKDALEPTEIKTEQNKTKKQNLESDCPNSNYEFYQWKQSLKQVHPNV